MKYVQIFKVTGAGRFPYDMLRYVWTCRLSGGGSRLVGRSNLLSKLVRYKEPE